MKEVISFEKYKDTGKIEYVEVDVDDEPDSLDDYAYVMNLSTDEIFHELEISYNTGKSLRNISPKLLMLELTSRLATMEKFCLDLLEAGIIKN